LKNKGIMLKFLLFLILPLSIMGLLSLLVSQQINQFYFPKHTQKVYGIDVSHHQKDIDWPQLAGSKVKFVYIKATEGATHQDKNFIKNWNGATQAGLIPAAYHFFTFCRSGSDQADNFLALFSQVKGKHLPIAVDVELVGNCPKRPTPDELAIELKDFLAKIKAKTGCKPILYTTPKFYNNHLAEHFSSYRLWIQSFHQKPKLKETSWTIWQFTNEGRVDGIETLVDLNVFKGSHESLEQFICH
jgi:lysozyme